MILEELSDFQLAILKGAAVTTGAASLEAVLSEMMAWRNPAGRGAMTANARRTIRAMEKAGLVQFIPGNDRWDSGRVFVTDAGRSLLMKKDRIAL